ncbi:cytidine deaminase-like protein [Geopyxis carbonaria]|nr:cytidine deaminase-like protein [Geopyxis carbonaria]
MTVPTTTDQHLHYLRLALAQAHHSPPTSTAYCIGAVLLSPTGSILSTGYTRELPGNTHAEECALLKLLPATPPAGSVLYTTMEPCSERNSGNKPCVERILEAGGIETVVVGVREPRDFVECNSGEGRLRKAGVGYVYVPGLEEEILGCAKRGHVKKEEVKKEGEEK